MRSVIPVALLVANSLPFVAQALASPQPIIIDTDLFGDVDDIGALAIANVLQNCGLADLKGVIINTPSEHGAPAASVSTLFVSRLSQATNISKSICSYFGNPEVPVAALRPLSNVTFFDDWDYV